MKKIGQSANFRVHLVDERYRLGRHRLRALIWLSGSRETIEIEKQGSQHLSGAVVKLPRDAPALFILRGQQMRAQVLHILLGLLELGDISRNDTDTINLPTGIPERKFGREIAEFPRATIQNLFLDKGAAITDDGFVFGHQFRRDAGGKEIGRTAAQEIILSQSARAAVCERIPSLAVLDVNERRRVIQNGSHLLVGEL